MLTRSIVSPVKSKLFAGLDDIALRNIFDLAQIRRIAPKTDVIVTGERPNYVFLMQKGRARSYLLTEGGSEILLMLVLPGVVLGLVSLLANPPTYMVNATTESESEFLVWDHGTIRRLEKSYPQITENGFEIALHYLGAYMKRHADIVTKSAEARLAHKLLQLATETGEVRPSGIEIDITNEQLSSMADIGYFTASRILSKWERLHKIRKQRGRVMLLAPESLLAA